MNNGLKTLLQCDSEKIPDELRENLVTENLFKNKLFVNFDNSIFNRYIKLINQEDIVIENEKIGTCITRVENSDFNNESLTQYINAGIIGPGPVRHIYK